MELYLPRIANINWKRNAEEWKRRVIRSNGRMINNAEAIILAGNVIKRSMQLPFTEDEQRTEQIYLQH